MLVLGIETSTPTCSVALVDDDRVCAHTMLDLGIHHSAHLFPMIQRVLGDRGVGLSDLDGIAVSSGPGSFTGVRIGAASAKAICMSMGLPLVGVSTLAGLAYSFASEGTPICAMLDARRNQVYIGQYECVKGQLVTRYPDRAAAIEEVMDHLPNPGIYVGDGARAHADRIRDQLGTGAVFVGGTMGHPHAGAIAILGSGLITRGDVSDPDSFEPTYLRTSQAEQVRQARLEKEGRS